MCDVNVCMLTLVLHVPRDDIYASQVIAEVNLASFAFLRLPLLQYFMLGSKFV